MYEGQICITAVHLLTVYMALSVPVCHPSLPACKIPVESARRKKNLVLTNFSDLPFSICPITPLHFDRHCVFVSNISASKTFSSNGYPVRFFKREILR